MNMLTRFDPFRDIDRLMEQLSTPRRITPAGMPLDIARGPDGYTVQADLPGVAPESIDVSVEGSVLTIRAQRASSVLDDMEVLSAERPTGSYVRQLSVGEGFDMENIQADYTHGVLTLKLPVAEKSKPRRIAVSVGTGSSAAIDTTSEEASTPSTA
jgi:HSP20 family protein